MPGVLDIGALGFQEDRTEAGLLRVKSTRGDAVLVPFRNGGYYATDTVGSGSGASFQAPFAQQEGGFAAGVNLTVGDVGFGFGTRLTLSFYGPIFGVAFQRSGLLLADHLSIGIDGEYFRVNSYNDWLTLRSVNLQDAYSLALVAEDIPDLPRGQPHTAEIVLASNHASGTNTMRLFGMLVDKRFGYSPPSRGGIHYLQTLTASQVAVNMGSSTTLARSVRKIFYYNSDVTARIVLLQSSSTVIYKESIPPGQTRSFDFGIDVVPPSTLTHAADVTSVVFATVIAGI